MTSLGMEARHSHQEKVKTFRQQVSSGLNQALSGNGPVLIVAHGGVHWMICCLLGVSNTAHEWAIGNCQPVHFYPETDNQWMAKKLPFPIT